MAMPCRAVVGDLPSAAIERRRGNLYSFKGVRYSKTWNELLAVPVN